MLDLAPIETLARKVLADPRSEAGQSLHDLAAGVLPIVAEVRELRAKLAAAEEASEVRDYDVAEQVRQRIADDLDDIRGDVTRYRVVSVINDVDVRAIVADIHLGEAVAERKAADPYLEGAPK